MELAGVYLIGLALAFCLLAASAEAAGREPLPVPRVQAVPQPYDQISFQRDGVEIARYHYGPTLERPFIFPIIGPSGRPLTRMGHPHDPVGHGHHNSVWTSHHDVNGVDFWSNRGGGRIGYNRIVTERIERLDDGPDQAAVIAHNTWTARSGAEPPVMLLRERRRIAIHALPKHEFFVVVDLELAAPSQERKRADVVLGKTPFGVFAVRMAKTIGVHDGAGTIRNSEGGVDEKGILWKRARWVDYSGAVADGMIEGITLMDHPSNPNHPTVFHVRNDGWMGSSLTHDGPRTIKAGQPLKLRYGLYIHAGLPEPKALRARFTEFTRIPFPEPPKPKPHSP